MNKHQLQQLVVEPTLKEIPKGYSEESVLALMMIAAHESLRGHYLKQVNGPALGIYQMEPATYYSIWKFGDSIWENAVLLGFVTVEQAAQKLVPKPENMIWNLKFATFMARQRLFMKPEKLPKGMSNLSMYLKKHWNSVLGAAGDYSYMNDYKEWK